MKHLRILGAVSLEREDGTSVRSVLAQPKRLALLAYLTLASPRGFSRRDTLLGIFWPELNEGHARAALSQALYYLRRSLGPDVLVRRGQEEVAVDLDRLWCDVTALDEKLDLGTVEACADAVELFRGDLLTGFFVSEAPEFERWLERERQRLRSRVAGAAWTLCDTAERKGRLSEAVDWARRALDLDETDEGGLRRLITLLDRNGDRAGAIDLYERISARLAHEYEIEPAPETQRLIETVLARVDADRDSEPAGVSSLPSGDDPDTSSQVHPSPVRVPTISSVTLRRIPLRRAAGVLAGAALVGMVLSRLGTTPPPDPGRPPDDAGVNRTRVAVLPLKNLSPSPEDAFVAEGLTAELTARLSRLRGLVVIPPVSIFRQGRAGRSAVEIGRALGVGTLIEGSVRKSGSSVRMTVQLLDVDTEAILWAGSFDAELGELLDAQRQVAEEVALQTKLSGSSASEAVNHRFGADAKAYEPYLRARAALVRDDWRSVRRARDFFLESVARDSTFAEAWSGLAHATNELIRNGVPTGPGSWEVARRAAERALAYDEELPEGHTALAVVHAMSDWSIASAETHFQRALDLDPSDVGTRLDYAVLLRNDGRFDKALAQVRRSRALDPLLPRAQLEEATVHYLAGRSTYAVQLLEGLLLGDVRGNRGPDGSDAGADPSAVPPFWPHFTLALARADVGDYDGALASLETADPTGARPDTRALRAYILAKRSQPDAARRLLDGKEGAPSIGPISDFHEAIVYVALGEHDRALDRLEAGARQRSRLLRLLKVEPTLEPLHSDPRYQALLVELGLAEPDEIAAAAH